MYKKMFLFVMVSIFFPSLNITAQTATKRNEKINRCIYIEWLGASNLIGVSYDSRMSPKSNWGYRAGISYYRDASSQLYSSYSNNGVFSPLEINYLLGTKKSRLELGVGVNLGFITRNATFLEFIDYNELKSSSTSQRYFGYYLFSNIGYRYQAKKGFSFRTGINPSFSFGGKHGLKKTTIFYPYVSFGYSF